MTTSAKIIYILAITIPFIINGCATMFNSGSQTIQTIPSDPDAKVDVLIITPSGSYRAKLPTTITAEPSNSEVRVEITDKCYYKTSTTVGKSVTPSYWVNILNGWGFLIDWATGKMWKYDNSVRVITDKKPDVTGCDA